LMLAVGQSSTRLPHCQHPFVVWTDVDPDCLSGAVAGSQELVLCSLVRRSWRGIPARMQPGAMIALKTR
jgi:hypothetical protein